VQECFFWPYSRSIILPENLAMNKIRATMENNLLIVEIPKLQFPSKSIKIDKLES
jgi:HSP20 family molecular chaperone IbpA